MAGWRYKDNVADVEKRAKAIVDKYPQLKKSIVDYASRSSSSTPTKAEQRTNNKVSTPTVSIKSSETAPPKASGSYGLTHSTKAEEIIRAKQESSSNFQKWYNKMDYGFGGYLPAGLSPTLVKAWDTEKKVPEVLANVEAQAQLEEAKTLKDFGKKSWYETLGFNYPQEEKVFQQREQAITEQKLITQQSPALEEAGFSPSYALDNLGSIATPPTSAISKYIPLAIAGVVLLMAVNSQ